MPGEPSPAPTGASAASPAASPAEVAPGDTLPFPVWALFGMGTLNCVTWVVATLLDLWTPKSSLAPMWLWNGLHVALILAYSADSLHSLQYLQCTGVDRMWCGHLVAETLFSACGGGWLLAIPGLFGALLGYAIGAWVARADYWR